jgi:hypothetical protein
MARTPDASLGRQQDFFSGAKEGPAMIISDSDMQLASCRHFVEQHEKREHLTVWKDGQQTVTTGEKVPKAVVPALSGSLAGRSVRLDISAAAKHAQPVKAGVSLEAKAEIKPMDSAKLNIMRLLVERLSGRKIRIITPADLHSEEGGAGDGEVQEAGSSVATEPESAGWGLVYDYYEHHYESESTQFSATGVIRTADGQEIDFTVDLKMSRSFASQESISIRAGDALKDPLVINFAGNAAELTESHFAFDLDLDGREDQIAFVRPGSGFLALDKNNDGYINDGSELFGPATGDGFAELSRYDEDENNWIDENDSIYARLRIWTKDPDGEDRLFALGQKGIGAIYLGFIDSPFALKDSANELQGQIQSTGLFVNEDLTVGTVQQVDMIV